MKRKVCFVITNRANYARLKPILGKVKEHPGLELQFVVGASAILERFGDITTTIRNDGFEINAEIPFIIEGSTPLTMAKSTGLGIIDLATHFYNLKPDIVFAHGDRFEVLSSVIAANYQNIFIAHNMSGEVSGTIDDLVRHAITRFSHLHLTHTKKAAERVISSGEEPFRVHHVGCSSVDVMKANLDKLVINERILNLLKNSGVGQSNINFSQGYLLVIQHPVTTEYPDSRKQVKETLATINQLDLPAIWLWPNIDAGGDLITKEIRTQREKGLAKNVKFYKNFLPDVYLTLLKNTRCAIGNSSSFIREGSFLGTPAVNIGSRQQNRERGENVIDVDYQQNEILDAINQQLAHGPYPSSDLYGDGQAAPRIVELLASVDINHKKRIF